ncbi:hypothetical protein ACWGCW_04540 [Streptomyces sp. NPDC054933]
MTVMRHIRIWQRIPVNWVIVGRPMAWPARIREPATPWWDGGAVARWPEVVVAVGT